MPTAKLKEIIKERIVIFDSAMGTELYTRNQFLNMCYDELCLTKPELVKQIHQENKQAGVDVLTTNSFGTNRFKLGGYQLARRVKEIARVSAEIAREVAGDELLVAGSVGPTGKVIGELSLSSGQVEEVFSEAIAGLKEGGADFVLLETFGRRSELMAGIKAVAAQDMPYIPSMAFGARNLTRNGEAVEHFYAPFPDELPEPLMMGFNCGVGPAQMLEQMDRFFPSINYPVLVQPNAGYPKIDGDRMFYMTTPEYFASYAKYFAQLGIRGLGGCCGTNSQHIRELAQCARAMSSGTTAAQLHPNLREGVRYKEPVKQYTKSRFARKLSRKEWVTSVELVPPLGWNLATTLKKAATCHEEGADAINIPDGPRASSRLSPMVTAFTIQHEVGIEPILHVTCRDRNVIGMQSDLLGCAAARVHNILIITGDPPKVGDYPFASAVFDIDSIGLTRIAATLNKGVDIGGHDVQPTRFHIGVGFDPTHLSIEREVSRFYQKVEAGAEFAITQPVFDWEKLIEVLELVKGAGIPIIAGIWPLTSLRNAEFLHNEVPGVVIPDWVMQRMAGANSKEEAREIGIEIARQILDEMREHVAGSQVSAPFGNVKTAIEVLA